MKTVTVVLDEQAVAALQQALDSHLKANGLAAFDAVAIVAKALNVPWDESEEKPAIDKAEFSRASRDVPFGE